MEMVFFIYQNAKPWLPLVRLLPSPSHTTCNLAVGQRRYMICQCAHAQHNRTSIAFLSIFRMHCVRAGAWLSWVMEPNNYRRRLYHLTGGKGSPNRCEKQVIFFKRDCGVVVHCAHGCTRILAHMFHFQTDVSARAGKKRKKKHILKSISVPYNS